MPAYKAYPTSKSTPSRRSRKSERNTVYRTNRKLTDDARKAARLARKEAA